jgi:hypothetical protein
MGRLLPPVATALVVVVGALVWFVPYLNRQREMVASTGASPPFANVTPVPLRAGGVACMTRVTIDTDAASAQFVVIPGRRPAPPLRVSTAGPAGYRGTAAMVPGGYREAGPRSAPISAPKRPLIGRVCVRNAGGTSVSLVGTTEKRTNGRMQTFVDGRPVAADISLQLLQGGSSTLLGETPEVVARMATFKGSFVSSAVFWLLLVLVVFCVPALVVAAVASAVSMDP